MTSPSTYDWEASGDYEAPNEAGAVRKMRRGELRELALRERERRLGAAAPAPQAQKEVNKFNRDSYSTPFQNLAENCGFKVICEEDNNIDYDGAASSRNDSSDGTSIRTNSTCTSMWSGDASPAVRLPEARQDRFQEIRNTGADFNQSQQSLDAYDIYDLNGGPTRLHHQANLPFRWSEYLKSKSERQRAKEKNSGVQFKVSRQNLSDLDRGDGEDGARPFTITAHNPALKREPTEECRGVKIDKVIPPQTDMHIRSFRMNSCSNNCEESPLERPKFVNYKEEINSSGNCRAEQKTSKDDTRTERRNLRNRDGCGQGRECRSKTESCHVECSPKLRQSMRCASDTELDQGEKMYSMKSPPVKHRRGGMVYRLKSLGVNPHQEKLQELRARKDLTLNSKLISQSKAGGEPSDGKRPVNDCQGANGHPLSKVVLSAGKIVTEVSPQRSLHCVHQCPSSPASKPRHAVGKCQSRCTECECEDGSSHSSSPDPSVSEGTQTGDVHSSPAQIRDANCLFEKRHQDYKRNTNTNYENTGVDDELTASAFIGQYLFELWKNQCLCDVRLKVGNTSFLAHKLVLAAFSDVFCPKEPQRVATICFDVPCTSPDAVFQILQYLYTSEMELTDSTLEDVHIAASFMGINEIVSLIEEILSKPTMYNFEKYMKIREKLGLPAYILDFQDLLRDHFIELINSPYFQALKLSDLEAVLQDVDIKVESEIDVINGIVKWIEYNPMKRMRYAANLLCTVNFDCMDPEALSEVVERNKHLFDLDAIAVLMEAFKKLALRYNETYCTDSDKGRRGSTKDKIITEKCFDIGGSAREADDDDCYICECHRMASNNCAASCNNSSVNDGKKLSEEPAKSLQEIRDTFAPKHQCEHRKQQAQQAGELDKNTSKCEEPRRSVKHRGSTANNSSGSVATSGAESGTSYRVTRKCGNNMSYMDSSPDMQSKKLKPPASLWDQQPGESLSPVVSDTDIEQPTPLIPQPPPAFPPRLTSRRDLVRRKDEGRTGKGIVYKSEEASVSDLDVSGRSGSHDRSSASRGSSRDSSECQRCHRSRSSSPSSRKSSVSDKGSRKRVTWLK